MVLQEAIGASIATLENHSHGVLTLSFSPDGSQVASGSEDHTLRLWDSATGISNIVGGGLGDPTK